MILTGRAKEDFIDYLWKSKFNKDDYKEYEDYIENQKESHTYADIIEWFDSVGVYINVSPNYLDHARKYSEGDFKAIINFKDGSNTISVDFPLEFVFNPCTRQEATKEAILKANDIYNESKN